MSFDALEYASGMLQDASVHTYEAALVFGVLGACYVHRIGADAGSATVFHDRCINRDDIGHRYESC